MPSTEMQKNEIAPSGAFCQGVASIIGAEVGVARRPLRRARTTLGNTLGEWLPFSIRVWLHVAVVVLVGWSACTGGSQLLKSQMGNSTQAVMVPTPPVTPEPIAEAAALVPLPSSLPVPAASPTPQKQGPAESEPPAAAKVAAPAPTQPEAMYEALAFSMEPSAELAAKAQEEGVMVARALATSRGGAREPSPTPTPLPTPTPQPTPVPRKEPLRPQTYEVVAGDTLLGIASKFGITPETILWANRLGNGELLQIGQKLTILPVSGVLHQVKKGQTFNGIAEAYGADPSKLVEANLLTNADQLQEGQVLIIPGGMLRTTEPITGLPSAPSQQELAAAPKYTVKAGDTLLSIADAFGVRPSVIQVANNLMNPDLLGIGQQLSIPGGRQAPAAAPKPQPAPSVKAAPAPAQEPPPPSGSGGDRVAAISQRYLGYRYVWGGTSPSGFDCSGFVWYVYKQAGIGIARSPLESQLGAGPRISRDKLLPGDLVFFQNTYKPGLSHVGIYLGAGRWINAESESAGVQIRSLSDPFWSAKYVGASRPW